MTKLLLASPRQLQFEDVQFAFRPNFEGRKEQYNRSGDRYFNIKIQDRQDAETLMDLGFNVKYSDPAKTNEKRVLAGKEPFDDDYLDEFWYMKVPVYTDYAPPTISIRDCSDIPDFEDEVYPEEVTYLPIELFGDVDRMETKNIDMIITYRQPHPDGKYMRPQLKNMMIDVALTPLERKHRFR